MFSWVLPIIFSQSPYLNSFLTDWRRQFENDIRLQFSHLKFLFLAVCTVDLSFPPASPIILQDGEFIEDAKTFKYSQASVRICGWGYSANNASIAFKRLAKSGEGLHLLFRKRKKNTNCTFVTNPETQQEQYNWITLEIRKVHSED